MSNLLFPCYLALAVIIFGTFCGAYQMTRCGLVRALRDHGFPQDLMRNWVCLVESESGRRTDVIDKPNSDGSRDYGLFQINDRYWCSNGAEPGKWCHVRCADLITDDITKASTCAQQIYQIQGFRAWNGWLQHCQGALPDISNCTTVPIIDVERYLENLVESILTP